MNEYFKNMYLAWARWIRTHYTYQYDMAQKIGKDDPQLGELMMRSLALHIEIRDYLKKKYVKPEDPIRRN